MKIEKILFMLLICLVPSICFGQSAGLDEIYRQIVRAENQEYLPMFVKNRTQPNFLKDLEDIEHQSTADGQSLESGSEVIELENKRKILEALQKAEELKWQGVVLAVQQNKVTPFELEEIEKRAQDNDPRATEVYAFMNARGQGINQDLIKAFLLYQKALELNVARAKENAILVYQSMNTEQRRILKSKSAQQLFE